MCYAYIPGDGLSGIAICDRDYPGRVAITLLKELVTEMQSGDNA